ncbi:MAG: leucine-rich repeat domain-containing protein, partial [Arcobacteraceae bacterium]
SAGTYYENIVIDNKNITLKSTDPADPATVAATIIDGQDQDSVVKILNGDTSTLEGFTIQNGNEPDYGGGGIFISGSSPIIQYNVIGDNTDDDVDTGNTGNCGGGICVVDGSIEPHIYQNKIIGNKGYYGGGMFIGYGSPLVENNIIKDNVSDDEGGGIIVVYSKKEGNSYCPTISNNIIEYNKTTNASGGGIVVDEEGSAIIENNQINNNETNFHGGGILIILNSDADIRGGNIIEDNKAGRHGGGIYIDSKGIISITSNTINNNRANIASGPYSGGGIYVNYTYSSPTIGGSTYTDTNNFNTICGNTPDQVDPDSFPNNDYCYFTFDSNTRTITDYSTSGGLDVNIPSAIGGVPVEHIGDQAFSSKGLKSIIIPDSVTSIGRYAFYTNELDEVTIPDSVTTIDYGAFNTNLLTSINFGNSVTDIGGYAFFNNALTSVTIPDNVKTIGSFSPHDGYTFANNQLTSINLGNSVATLGYGVFEGNQLTSVTIPNSVTTICDDVFKSNTLTSVTIGDGVYIVDSYSDTMGTNMGFRTAYTGAGTYNYDYIDEAWKKEEK